MENDGVMGKVISVFVLVLVVSVVVGMSFLFTGSLKTQVITSSEYSTYNTVNVTGHLNGTPYYFLEKDNIGFRNVKIIAIQNVSAGQQGAYLTGTTANWTLSATSIRNATDNTQGFYRANITYSYEIVSNLNAYNGVNKTEAAGATIVNYLPLVFLALIFGVILILVLKIILPYINFGNQMGGSF